MSTALPTGTQIAEWGGFRLHDYLSNWQDQNLGRIAQHTFDRRDGGQNEDMGAAARVCRVTLIFEDTSGFKACRDFIDLWRANKTRLFVHPVWGRYNATFIGIESGSLAVDQGANRYTVQGQFVESNINADTVQDGAATVPGKAAAADAQIDTVTLAAADFSAAVATVSLFTSAASTFNAAALVAASTSTPNPSLPALLSASLTGATASIAAIRAAAGDDPTAYDAVAACEILAAMQLDLGAAYLAQQPPTVEYVPGEPTPLLAIANLWYPGDAINRLSQLAALNPALVGVIVPSGFRMLIATT